MTVPGLPRFVGGLVGYLGYEMMRFFEPVLKLEPRPDLPDAIFLQADTLVAFDHAYGRLLLIANAAGRRRGRRWRCRPRRCRSSVGRPRTPVGGAAPRSAFHISARTH